jgi:tRNA pseudouridine-54 N-methylase
MQPQKALPSDDVEGTHIDISKKDVAGLIRRILFKYKPGQKTQAYKGYTVEKKSLLNVVEDCRKEGKTIYVLDKEGEDIRTAKIDTDCVFILGDHDGLPIKELKRLKRMCVPVSIGERMYFASQVVAIVNNELDRRGI